MLLFQITKTGRVPTEIEKITRAMAPLICQLSTKTIFAKAAGNICKA